MEQATLADLRNYALQTADCAWTLIKIIDKRTDQLRGNGYHDKK